ncbi:uncharacterized protein LOC131663011 [Phymastichus coffea]|uniref:uncharacterized protein LOC131663011 n=1 Tax=Phymastichus coffea TaxID=108790 RepID=UPI00273B2254|nr:uncharacterized protein LOC131663011 [Phymastichus coffea]
MVLTVGDLHTNKNFILKIAVLFEGIFVIFLFWPKFLTSITACEFSHLVIITTLLITYMFFESTPRTEICLLGASLMKLTLATTVYLFMTKSELMDRRFFIHVSFNGLAIIIIIFDIWMNIKLSIQ